MRIMQILIVALTTVILPFTTTIATENIETSKAGTYPIKVTYIDETGRQHTKTAYMTVTKSKTTINREVGEAIDAHDIITTADPLTLTKDQLITQAAAHAWRLENGEQLPITTVTTTMLDNTIKLYQVIFQTANGTTATIQLLQTDTTNIITQAETYTYFDTGDEGLQTTLIISLSSLVLLPILILVFVFWLVQKKQKKLLGLLYEEQLLSFPFFKETKE